MKLSRLVCVCGVSFVLLGHWLVVAWSPGSQYKLDTLHTYISDSVPPAFSLYTWTLLTFNLHATYFISYFCKLVLLPYISRELNESLDFLVKFVCIVIPIFVCWLLFFSTFLNCYGYRHRYFIRFLVFMRKDKIRTTHNATGFLLLHNATGFILPIMQQDSYYPIMQQDPYYSVFAMV